MREVSYKIGNYETKSYAEAIAYKKEHGGTIKTILTEMREPTVRPPKKHPKR